MVTVGYPRIDCYRWPSREAPDEGLSLPAQSSLALSLPDQADEAEVGSERTGENGSGQVMATPPRV